MSLTDVEQRSLEAVSEALHNTDPRLARMLARGGVRRRMVDVVTVIVAVGLITMLIVGIALQLRIVCACAWTGTIGFSIVRGMYADGGY